jgi:hypothetical protein
VALLSTVVCTQALSDKFLERMTPHAVVIVSLLGFRPIVQEKESRNTEPKGRAACMVHAQCPDSCSRKRRQISQNKVLANSFEMLELPNP